MPHDQYHNSSGYGNDAYYDNYDSYSYNAESTTNTEIASSETTADTVGASATQGADNSISATDVALAQPAPPATLEGTIPIGSADGTAVDSEPRPRQPRGPAVVA